MGAKGRCLDEKLHTYVYIYGMLWRRERGEDRVEVGKEGRRGDAEDDQGKKKRGRGRVREEMKRREAVLSTIRRGRRGKGFR